ncbi:MAG: hypothetical protein AYK18_08725 [Theionarchaea archaeon DG-70]|nr:MAG: hypothetical protein AYK18_08725 [Theionarchaea archaeon DG-70]
MKKRISLDAIYKPSEDIVAREIEGELIIVPLVSGMGDMEDDLFTFNDTGKIIWTKLNGKRRLIDVVNELSKEYESPPSEIEKDVVGLIEELLKRRMVTEASKE